MFTIALLFAALLLISQYPEKVAAKDNRVIQTRARVDCCTGYIAARVHVHNCLAASGGCCADNVFHNPSNGGKIGTVNARKVSSKDTSGNCGQCFNNLGKCNV
jgi:hypothetical protein